VPALGSSVTQTSVLATVSDLGRLQVAAGVNEVDAAQVRKGQKADVQVTAVSGKTFAGQVVSIDSQATTTQGVVSYNLVVALDTDAVAAGLKPGMSATARVLTGSSASAVLVPVDALQRLRGNWAVLMRGADGSLQPRQVELGIIGTTHAEVIKGLADGDTIEVAATRGTSSNTNQRQPGTSQFGQPAQPAGTVPQVPTNRQPGR
jgi:HlyD family secretion protein